ncbi:MAG: reverse transcriptase/maturase family protein [Bryobacteraceae bacterium]
MKRVGGLWDTLVSFDNVHEAARRAALGKRRRPDVAAFLLNAETELVLLRRELQSGEYQSGPYREFRTNDGKPRLISAAPFRDRVVHHTLTQVLEPVFERRFSRDSYACRAGLGTHKALERARWAAARFPYVLKCDVRKYFASIDQQILKGLLARVVKCRRTLDLAGRIIDGWNGREEAILYFPEDDLFTPVGRRRGLPLGNQTSQFFANVYLNPLDHFVNQRLRPGCYIRYVDDFVLFDHSKERLAGMRIAVEGLLDGLRLRLHERKSRVYRCADGVTFLGWRVFPERTRLVRANVVQFRRRLREMGQAYAEGTMDRNDVRARIHSWIGHASFGDTWRLREQVFGQFTLVKRSAV